MFRPRSDFRTAILDNRTEPGIIAEPVSPGAALTPNSPRTAFEITGSGWFWLVLSFSLVVLSWYKGINLMLLLSYFFLAMFLLNLIVARRMVSRIRGSRRAVTPVFAREEFVRAVEIHNGNSPVVGVLITDTDSETAPDARWLVDGMKPGHSEILRTHSQFPNRGQPRIGPLMAKSGFPFGFVVWRATLEPGDKVSVLPAIGHIAVDGLRRFLARSAGGEGRTRRPARRAHPGLGDVRGVRPYRVGDSPRDVHWRTTARRGQVFVREYDQTDPLNLVVILDPWMPESGAKAVDRDHLEWAFSLVASIAWTWTTADEPGEVTVLLPGHDPIQLAGVVAAPRLRQVLEPLSSMTGGSDSPSFHQSAFRPQAPRTARLVVSTRTDSPVASGLRKSGIAVASVDPTMKLGWYLPPGE